MSPIPISVVPPSDGDEVGISFSLFVLYNIFMTSRTYQKQHYTLLNILCLVAIVFYVNIMYVDICLLCQHNNSPTYDLIPKMMLQRKNIKVIIEYIHLQNARERLFNKRARFPYGFC